MGEVLEVVVDLPPMLKMGWGVFAAWSLTQAVWYRRTRVAAPAKPVRKRSRNSSARRAVARGTAHDPRSSEREARSTEFLDSLGLLTTPGASEYSVPMTTAGRSGPTVA
jgi:hypothetical protein